MSAEKGLSFLLKLGAVVIAGMRTTSFTINGEEVDITNKDSSGWRELLAGAGVTDMAISAAGVFQDDATFASMRVNCIAKTLDTYTLLFESGDDYTGSFQCTAVEQAGEYNGEVTYTLSLASSGVIAFTAV